MNLKMELFISDNGKKESDTEEENSIGMMDHFMKVIGDKIWLMAKED